MKRKNRSAVADPVFQLVPAAVVSITPHFVHLYGQSAQGKPLVVEFAPYQGIKFTTIDCFRISYKDFRCIPDQITEVPNSPWLKEMRRALRKIDSTATFLNDSKHYFLPAQDAVIEIISWGWTAKNLTSFPKWLRERS